MYNPVFVSIFAPQDTVPGTLMRCSESTSERSSAGWWLLLKGERRASVPGLSVWLMKK